MEKGVGTIHPEKTKKQHQHHDHPNRGALGLAPMKGLVSQRKERPQVHPGAAGAQGRTNSVNAEGAFFQLVANSITETA